ncbi:MAG: hypothetical protein HeimC2_24500 [Candidatus Heimdallarchaeota archaeon LC_2]|nr:MAG: hypothetical protein HeimC2_24500 [Candidatus Heimdallarchaeota archaeon LC_2]
MSDTFSKMLKVLEKFGSLDENAPLNKNGKVSKFKGTVTTQVGDRRVNLGVLYYPWNRTIGVNKIHQALQFTENADLEGAVIVGTKFTTSAIEQAFRNNKNTDKRFLLMESDEITAMMDTLDQTELNP